jgi:hypothetical protein
MQWWKRAQKITFANDYGDADLPVGWVKPTGEFLDIDPYENHIEAAWRELGIQEPLPSSEDYSKIYAQNWVRVSGPNVSAGSWPNEQQIATLQKVLGSALRVFVDIPGFPRRTIQGRHLALTFRQSQPAPVAPVTAASSRYEEQNGWVKPDGTFLPLGYSECHTWCWWEDQGKKGPPPGEGDFAGAYAMGWIRLAGFGGAVSGGNIPPTEQQIREVLRQFKGQPHVYVTFPWYDGDTPGLMLGAVLRNRMSWRKMRPTGAQPPSGPVTAGKREQYDGIDVLVNPSKDELIGWAKRTRGKMLRGLFYLNDTYWWDGNRDTHWGMIQSIGGLTQTSQWNELADQQKLSDMYLYDSANHPTEYDPDEDQYREPGVWWLFAGPWVKQQPAVAVLGADAEGRIEEFSRPGTRPARQPAPAQTAQ